MVDKLMSLINHQGFLRYLRNTSWMLAEQLLRIVAGLFVGVWVARYLGPEQFGIFSYALAFTAIFAGIAKLGLDGIVVRELVNNPEKQDVYIGTAFWLKVISSLFVMGLISALVPYTSNDSTTNLFILIISIGLVFQSFEVVEFYFQSQVLAKIVSICKVTQLAVSSVIKIYLVMTQSDLIWFVVITAFDAFFLALAYCLAYAVRRKKLSFLFFDFATAQKMLKDSWPLIFTAIFAMLYARVDQLMIKEFLGGREVGLYSASIKVTEAWLFLPMVITSSLFPSIVKAKAISRSLYEDRINRLYTLIVILGLLVCILVSCYAEWIILTLFGRDYVEGSSVLSIRIWETFFASVGVVSSKWLIVENLQRKMVSLVFLGALINVALNAVFIPLLGIDGAALASLISIIFTIIILPYFIKPLRGNVIMRVKAILLITLFRMILKK